MAQVKETLNIVCDDKIDTVTGKAHFTNKKFHILFYIGQYIGPNFLISGVSARKVNLRKLNSTDKNSIPTLLLF